VNLLHESSGVIVRRVVDRSDAEVPEHAHDWPVLSIFVLGGYLNQTEAGERRIDGPSAVFYRAGAAHRNRASSVGFEQIEIEFDPAWMAGTPIPDAAVSHWLGGRPAALARSVALYCAGRMTADGIRTAIRRLLASRCDHGRIQLAWIDAVSRRLRQDPSLRVHEIAREMARHPSWLGSAYKQVTGEGLPVAAVRFRVECAARLLRETERSYACIALDAGFCDQSHMNRSFRSVVGRLPTSVRQDRYCFRGALPAASQTKRLGHS
jgi:AraC-like DNA-binding protein